jgi:hypothetical protein
MLGQRYLALETGDDPLLREVARRLQHDNPLMSYSDLLRTSLPMDRETWLAWLDERCRRINEPTWLARAADFPWSGFYTSAIDSVWPNVFRRPWRELQPLFEERFRPADPRNRSVLHCTYLFGSVNRTEDGERPPVTRFEWSRRSQVAVALARRLPEFVTPMGTLVIEGYAGNNDWLPPEQLMPILADFGVGQVHIFSVDSELESDPYVRELTKSNQVTLHRGGLANMLGDAATAGIIQLGPQATQDYRSHQISFEKFVVSVPAHLWNRVSRTATIVDDSVLADPVLLSPDAAYAAFRDFLSTADGEPNWPGYARGFAFRRAFERQLERIVNRRLDSHAQNDEPIILHGQTGSGKTVALAALAYRMRRGQRCPVLFIDRRSQRPVPSDIDAFCRWSEDAGATATLIIWDGMIEVEEYGQLLRYLASRGRQVVLVGSTYRQTTESPNLISAPGELETDELRRFVAFLERVEPSLRNLAAVISRLDDDTFLVALYRLLPPTRSAVRQGVSREMEFVEAELARRAAGAVASVTPTTALAAALMAAGLVPPNTLAPETTRLVAGEQIGAFQDLTNLVMVPARFGLRVPLEVLLRVLDQVGYTKFRDLLEGVDIVRWFEDATGNVELGCRSSLEARLLVQSRIGGASAEIEYVRRLLMEIVEPRFAGGMNREAAFAQDLLRAFGPKSTERSYYAPYFRELADTLRELREERGVQNPGLMLTEANLHREWALAEADRPGADQAVVSSALEQAHDILTDALLEAPEGTRGDRRLRASILVERAATIGQQVRRLLKDGQIDQARALFDDLRDTFVAARQENPSSYYPIDVLAWVTRDLLDMGALDDTQRAEAIAELLYAFDTANVSDFDLLQTERFHSRRLEIGTIISDIALSDDAFERLRVDGSTAGYYLRAAAIAPKPADPARPTQEDIQRACDASSYLEDNRSAIAEDPRPLSLLLQLSWMCETGQRWLESNRFAPALLEDQWRDFLNLTRSIEATGRATREIDLAYFRAVCLFNLNIVGESFAVFREEVERASYAIRSRRRLIRAYLASNPDGTPRTYHGTIQTLAADERKGDLFVEEIRRSVQFLTNDFSLAHPAPGMSLGEFHIAFNFLGPIAEPVHFYRAVRRRGSET